MGVSEDTFDAPDLDFRGYASASSQLPKNSQALAALQY